MADLCALEHSWLYPLNPAVEFLCDLDLSFGVLFFVCLLLFLFFGLVFWFRGFCFCRCYWFFGFWLFFLMCVCLFFVFGFFMNHDILYF